MPFLGEFGFCCNAASYENIIDEFDQEIVAAYSASRQRNIADFDQSGDNKEYFKHHSDNFYRKLKNLYGKDFFSKHSLKFLRGQFSDMSLLQKLYGQKFVLAPLADIDFKGFGMRVQ